MLFLLKIFCPENTSVGHLNDYYSRHIDWKGHAQASLSLHRPLIRKSLPRSTWKLLMLELILCVWKLLSDFCFLQSLRFLIAPTKLLKPLLSVIVDSIVLLNYVHKTLELDHCVYVSIFLSAISICLLKIVTNKGKTTEQLAHHLIINLFSFNLVTSIPKKKDWYFTPLGQIISFILI